MRGRPRALVALAAAVLLLSGCSASSSDIRPIAADALAATRSAELGLQLIHDGRTFPTTHRMLLDEMTTQLGDTITELEQTQTADDSAEQIRRRTLAASRHAVDALHLAQRGDEREAASELRAASTELEKLAGKR